MFVVLVVLQTYLPGCQQRWHHGPLMPGSSDEVNVCKKSHSLYVFHELTSIWFCIVTIATEACFKFQWKSSLDRILKYTPYSIYSFHIIQIQLQNSIFKHFETVTTNLLSLTFKTLANVSNSENSKASWHILPLLYNYKLYIHVKTSCKISVISYFTMSCKTFFEHTKSLWGENVHMYSVYKIQITASWYQVTPITNFINSKYIHKMMHI